MKQTPPQAVRAGKEAVEEAVVSSTVNDPEGTSKSWWRILRADRKSSSYMHRDTDEQVPYF